MHQVQLASREHHALGSHQHASLVCLVLLAGPQLITRACPAGLTLRELQVALHGLGRQLLPEVEFSVQALVPGLRVVHRALSSNSAAGDAFHQLTMYQFFSLLNSIRKGEVQLTNAAQRQALRAEMDPISAALARICGSKKSPLIVRAAAHLVRARMPAADLAQQVQAICSVDKLLQRSEGADERFEYLLALKPPTAPGGAWVAETMFTDALRATVRLAADALYKTLSGHQDRIAKNNAMATDVPGLLGDCTRALGTFASSLVHIRCSHCGAAPTSSAQMLRACKRCQAARYCSQCALPCFVPMCSL